MEQLNEEKDSIIGDLIGQCKWFNDRLGYGFITVVSGADQKGVDQKGVDIFVHHSGIKPLNSNYKTLKKGEYVNFSIINGENGSQGVNVTGICGGSLMCDILPSAKPVQQMNVDQGFTVVPTRRPRGPRILKPYHKNNDLMEL